MERSVIIKNKLSSSFFFLFFSFFFISFFFLKLDFENLGRKFYFTSFYFPLTNFFFLEINLFTRTKLGVDTPQSSSPFSAFTQTEHRKPNHDLHHPFFTNWILHHDQMVITPSMDGDSNLGFWCRWRTTDHGSHCRLPPLDWSCSSQYDSSWRSSSESSLAFFAWGQMEPTPGPVMRRLVTIQGHC